MADTFVQIYTAFMGAALIYVNKLFVDKLWLRISIIASGVGLIGLGIGGLLGIVE
jgi:hypothetical protein